MGTKYATESISGYNATPPADDGTVSEANKVKWSTIKTKLPDPLKTAIENIDSKLTTHFNVGPTALTTTTTLDSTHFNKVIQVSGSGVTLNLTDANTLGAGWFCDIISTDTTNNVTLARATASNTINETSADVTILPLQALKVIVNAAGTGFLVNTGARHSKTYQTAEDTTLKDTLVIYDPTDPTKKIRFDAGSITTATTRVVTMGDADFTLVSATQAQQETGTATTVIVTPGVQHHHPSAAKTWGQFGTDGSTQASYNVTSITDTGTGTVDVTIATDFSSASWSAVAVLFDTNDRACQVSAKAAGTVTIRAAAGTADPSNGYFFAGFGDQA